MEWLRANVRVSPLHEIVSLHCASGQRRAFPERTVVLTFDDGFRDFFSAAAPVLHRLRLPAIVFLPTGYCEKTSGWPSHPVSVAEEALLGWKQVAELVRQGFCFGAHSISHASLTDLPADAGGALEIATGARRKSKNALASPLNSHQPTRTGDGILGCAILYTKHYRGAHAPQVQVSWRPVLDACSPFRESILHYVRQPARFQLLFTSRFLALSTATVAVSSSGEFAESPREFYARV